MAQPLAKARSNPEPEVGHHSQQDTITRSRTTYSVEREHIVTAHFLDDFGAHHYNPDLDDDDGSAVSSSASVLTSAVTEKDSRDQDLEKFPSKSDGRETREAVADPYLVTWDGDKDPENPKNWSYARKWTATTIVSLYSFLSPVSSSLAAPALPLITRDLDVTSSTVSSLLLSVFVGAYAIGPLFLGPLSEIYGRRIILQTSNIFFLAFNLACGFATSTGQLIAFRFLAGLGGSAPLAIGGGTLSDCWSAEERAQAVGIYSLMPLLGPAIGPIAGGWIAEETTWKWCFYSTSILSVVVQAFGLVFLKEPYAPVILAKKAATLRKKSDDSRYHTVWENPKPTLSKVLKASLSRPFRMLGTDPIIQILSLYMAFIYGLMYLVLTTYSSVFHDVYRERVGITGLNYISLGLGFFIGAQTVARANTKLYLVLKKRNGGIGKPEYRIPVIVPGALILSAGLFMYGWSAEAHTHWIVPNIGAVLIAAGTIAGFQCIQTYLVDAYSKYAASAVGAATVLRSLFGFGFPLFAQEMYASLGLGWGNSLLAFLGLAIGVPAPFLL